MYGMVWCNECMGFHAPIPGEMPGFGGGYGGFGELGGGGFGGMQPGNFGGGRGGFPTGLPTIQPIGGGRGPLRDPWGGIDPFKDAIPGGITGTRPGGGWPPQQQPISRPPPMPTPQPPPTRPPQQTPTWSPPQPTPTRAPPPPRPPVHNPTRSRPSGRGRGADYSKMTQTPEGGITDHRSINVPALPAPNPSGRAQPIYDKYETFMRSDLLANSDRHPTAPSYPQRLSTRPPDTSQLTAEQASARAFVLFCMQIVRWNEIMEDLYQVCKTKPLPATLQAHLNYFLKAVIPHLAANGEVPPGDYCKIRALLDWLADHSDSFGTAITWSFGFGKGRGRARERGWWRKEREGFPEGPGVNAI